jgi:hypothetical protein
MQEQNKNKAGSFSPSPQGGITERKTANFALSAPIDDQAPKKS